jgi:PII-like signaling protein
MNDDCLKLTTYFGERDRANGGFLADAFTDIYARHALQTSLVMRGVEGFGAKQHLRTDRLLTLSEDLPLVSVAVDTRQRIDAALADVDQLRFQGLITLERARMLTGRVQTVELPWEDHAATKLTAYLGRHERINGSLAYEAIVSFLHGRGVAGATVLLGVDGTAHGVRERAKFFGHNAAVPLMVIAVGDSRRIADALPELATMLQRPLMTLERVRVCKRDGEKLTEPQRLPGSGCLAETDGLQRGASPLRRPAAAPASHPRAARSTSGRCDQSARHLGLPRRPPAPRRLVLATAPPRPRGHRHRRHAGTHPPMVRDRRPAHRRDRVGHQRAGAGLPCDGG